MPDWLIEGDVSTLVLLLLVALCSGVAWWKTRRSVLAVIAVIFLVLAAAFVALDYAFESDREQVKRRVVEVADAIKMPLDVKKMFDNVSGDFQYRAYDKKAFQDFCERAVRHEEVRRFAIWDYRTESLDRQKKTARVYFNFKVETSRERGAGAFFLARADFKLDDDNKWRLSTFEIYPGTIADQPLEIPNLR